MATREFALPDVGEGVAEGELVEWLVAVGDRVTEDQPVAEVETDKALVEVPSPVDGVVAELRAEAGEVVPVGDVIVVFETDADDETGTGTGADAGTQPEADTGTAARGGRVFAAPSARRLARELDVDIERVEGSGPGGRVTESDVRSHAEGASDTGTDEGSGGGTPAPASFEPGSGRAATRRAGGDGTSAGTSASTDAGGGGVAPADRDRTLAAPATRKLAEELDVDLDAVPTDEERDGEAFVTPEHVRAHAEGQAAGTGTEPEPESEPEPGPAAAEEDERVETIPYRGIRRTIGDRMAESVYTAPHVTHHDVADVSTLVDLRAELAPVAEERGAGLTYLPFVMKAVVAALREHPILNSTLDEDAGEIRLKGYYDLGVAVATDAGLLVPVVEGVDSKGLLALAREVRELAERARERNLDREEMRGSTFTITNFGAVGGEYATPIINYPETAILGLGRIDERPRVVDGEVVARHTLPLSLSIDHRVIDGAEAAAFANTLIEYLEQPARLLLE